MTLRNARGFSLVEIMVVVAIIGAVAAMSAGSFTNWVTQANFRTQKAVLLEALTRARNMANSRDECAKVTVDGQSIHVVGYTSGTNSNCSPVGTQTVSLSDFVIANGFTVSQFSNSSASIVFNQQGGVVDLTNYVEISIADPKGMKQVYRIYPALGQIRTMAAGS